MSLLGMVVANKGLQLLYQAGSSYLQSENDAKVVVEQVIPVVSKALEAKTADKKGLGDMLKYLEGAGLQRFVENPDLIKTEEAKNAGLGVLSNLLGLSPTSGKMVGVLASRTGLSSSAVQSLLPIAASIVMGSLSKNVLQPDVKNKILDAVNRKPRFGFLSAFGGLFGGGSSGHIGKSVLGAMIASGVDHDEKWVQDAFSND